MRYKEKSIMVDDGDGTNTDVTLFVETMDELATADDGPVEKGEKLVCGKCGNPPGKGPDGVVRDFRGRLCDKCMHKHSKIKKARKAKKFRTGTHVTGSTVSGHKHYGKVDRMHPSGDGRVLVKLHHPYDYGARKITHLWVSDVSKHRAKKVKGKTVKVRKSEFFFKGGPDRDTIVLHPDDIPTKEEINWDAEAISESKSAEERPKDTGLRAYPFVAPMTKGEAMDDLEKGGGLKWSGPKHAENGTRTAAAPHGTYTHKFVGMAHHSLEYKSKDGKTSLKGRFSTSEGVKAGAQKHHARTLKKADDMETVEMIQDEDGIMKAKKEYKKPKAKFMHQDEGAFGANKRGAVAHLREASSAARVTGKHKIGPIHQGGKTFKSDDVITDPVVTMEIGEDGVCKARKDYLHPTVASYKKDKHSGKLHAHVRGAQGKYGMMGGDMGELHPSGTRKVNKVKKQVFGKSEAYGSPLDQMVGEAMLKSDGGITGHEAEQNDGTLLKALSKGGEARLAKSTWEFENLPGVKTVPKFTKEEAKVYFTAFLKEAALDVFRSEAWKAIEMVGPSVDCEKQECPAPMVGGNMAVDLALSLSKPLRGEIPVSMAEVGKCLYRKAILIAAKNPLILQGMRAFGLTEANAADFARSLTDYPKVLSGRGLKRI